MTNVLEVKILTKLTGPRQYCIKAEVNGEKTERTFNDCNNAYAAHYVLREIIYNSKNVKVKLKTNVNVLLDDLKTLETNQRTLSRYLREVLESSGSQIVSAEYTAL